MVDEVGGDEEDDEDDDDDDDVAVVDAAEGDEELTALGGGRTDNGRFGYKLTEGAVIRQSVHGDWTCSVVPVEHSPRAGHQPRKSTRASGTGASRSK